MNTENKITEAEWVPGDPVYSEESERKVCDCGVEVLWRPGMPQQCPECGGPLASPEREADHTHCGYCGKGFEPLARVMACADCTATFCDPECIDEHTSLGCCPKFADGVLAEPQS